MALIVDWLAVLGLAGHDALGRALSDLPGRPVYPGTHVDRALASAEFSVRRDATGKLDRRRFAYSVDPDRAPRGAVTRFLSAHVTTTPAVSALLPTLEGTHVQVGLADRRAKLYVYARGAPEGTIERVLDTAQISVEARERAQRVAGRAPAFIALDLESDRVAAKLYFEHGDAASATGMLAALGHERLAARAAESAPAWGTLPAPLVVSLRADAGGERDVTLHVKMDRRGDLEDALAAEVRIELSRLKQQAVRHGVALRPTYLSDLDEQGAASVQTLYYRLVSETR